MRILVTNDDGYMAVGIRTLADAARTLGEVTVVAPDREQSATSHSLTLHHPLRVRASADDVQVVDGTPTDCVMLGLGELLAEKPDFVFSGINHGSNLGDDVLYSGTVAAAMESAILGIPSIALSFASRDADRIPAYQDVIAKLLKQLVEQTSFPNETLLNVNIPPVDPDTIKGVRVTTLGRRLYEGSLTRARDPNGKEYFWIGGGESKWWGSDDSDFRAIHDGYISVTPVHMDLTNYKLLAEIERWSLTL
jgi:5'-nucleotidase